MSRCTGRACRSATAGERKTSAISGGEGTRRPVPDASRVAGAGKVRLGDVCKIIGGGTPSKSNASFYTGNIPWASVRDMKEKMLSCTEYCISDVAVENSATNIIPKGEVVISTHVGLGKVCVLAQDTAINQDLKAIIPIEELNRDYLYHWFVSQAGFIISHGHGITVKGVSVDFVKSMEIPLPPLPVQRRIAAELDRLCALKKNAEDRLAILDQLVKSRFVEMFGCMCLRSTKIDFSEICEFVTVGIANSATHAYSDSGVVMLRNQNIKENFLDDADIAYIKPDFAAKYHTKTLRENDLLIVRTGYPGVACLVPRKYEGAQTFTTLIARLKDCERTNPVYICHFINSEFGKRFVESKKVGIAQQNFGAKALGKMPMLIPPLALQREFAAFVASVDKSKAALRETVATLDQLYRAKLQECFG